MRTLFRLGSKLLEELRYYRYRMRIADLLARGLVLGKNVTIEYTAYIDDDFPYLVRIGDNCSIANHVVCSLMTLQSSSSLEDRLDWG